MIKDRRCNTAQAAFALAARYRWSLTGTPLQNRVTELYSLVRFLRLYPYAHYFADKTGCRSLDFPFKNDPRKCDLCAGGRMQHYCWWNRRVANPIKYCGYEGRGRTAMAILKHQILPKILLRRTKARTLSATPMPRHFLPFPALFHDHRLPAPLPPGMRAHASAWLACPLRPGLQSSASPLLPVCLPSCICKCVLRQIHSCPVSYTSIAGPSKAGSVK